jgi:hypothetical protein
VARLQPSGTSKMRAGSHTSDSETASARVRTLGNRALRQ